MLSSPVAAMAFPVLDPNGTLTGFRQEFTQERKSQSETVVLDTQLTYSAGATSVTPASGPNGWPRRTDVNLFSARAIDRSRSSAGDLASLDLLSRVEALERSAEQVNQSQRRVQAENDRISARNRTIALFMSNVVGKEFSADPSSLWQWWDEVNETEYQSLKPSNLRYETAALVTRNYSEMAAAAALGGSVVAGECFARGTPVLTRKGFRIIESLRAGDLVLSRDIPTGELSWKAVMRTTTRPPRPVYKVSLDNESVRCTGGHLFWVSGSGWTKASQLRPGDVLNAADQPVVVMKVDQLAEEQTYNLVVDQTQTYFVGKQMVLTHDVTDRVPTHIKVPGLTPSAAPVEVR